MDTQAVQGKINLIDKFLGKQMLENQTNEATIKKIREEKVIEVTVHGTATEKINIEGLEKKFQKQAERRVTIPSQDILQHNAKFPLHETSEDFLKELSDQFQERKVIEEAAIKDKEAVIEEELSKNQTAQQTARNITEIFNSPNQTVKTMMHRKIQDALKAGDINTQKTKIMEVLLDIFTDGISIDLISQNKAKWGALNNRRGQIGENKTMTAVNQVLENFLGMSVMGMKTHNILPASLKT